MAVISLTSGNCRYDGEKEKYLRIYERISPYFSQIAIGVKTAGATNKVWMKYTCSLFQLLINSDLRTQFLEYTASSTDEITLTLRKVLQNPEVIESNICKIAGKLGDLCLKEKIQTFQIEGYCYTKENYLKGGENQKFRLSFDDSIDDEEEVLDLTTYYYKQKAKEIQKNPQSLKR